MTAKKEIIRLAALLLIVALVFACGGNRHAVRLPSPHDHEQTIETALGQLDALPRPDSVDAKLWNELKAALKSALTTNNQRLLAKNASTPPFGPSNKVNDLTATRETNGSFTLSWHYRNVGDYDQNGVVSVTDITPLAMHYGEEYDRDTRPDCIQAVIDGSGNGEVGIEDITPIAANFGVEVARYSVQGADAIGGPFTESVTEGVVMPESTARKSFSVNIGASPQSFWQVVPEDTGGAQGDASNIAGIALQIQGVTPTSVKEGTVVTFSADVLGAGPLTYEWDFGGQAVPSTSTEASPKVVLTRDTGNFPARITVTGPLGSASYPFTLTKLAREWKHEVVWEGLQPVTVGTFVRYSLQYVNQELWFYVADNTGSSERYIIHGQPNDWKIEDVQIGALLQMRLDVGSNGQPFIMYTYGSLSDRTLVSAVYGVDTWLTNNIAHAMSYYYLSYCLGPNSTPFVTYALLPPEADPLPIHSWHLEDGESYDAILDHVERPSYPGQGEITSTGSEVYPPVSVYVDGIDADHSDMRCATWNETQEAWDISTIEVDGDSVTWKTGLFPVVKYDANGDSGLAYSQITQEITPGVQDDKLIYRQLSGGVWSQEEVDERVHPSSATCSYEMKDLVFDPLGNPVIAYAYYKGTAADSDRDIVVEWKTPGGWIQSIVYEAGSASTSGVGIAFDDKGTPYVLYGDKTNQEVILARYE